MRRHFCVTLAGVNGSLNVPNVRGDEVNSRNGFSREGAKALHTLRNKLASEPSICGGRAIGEPYEDSSAEPAMDDEIEDEEDAEI